MKNQVKKVIITLVETKEGSRISIEKENISQIELLGLLRFYEQETSISILNSIHNPK